MLQTVLAIAGKPGLYRLVSRGNKNLIVESLDAAKKRTPIFGADKVISLVQVNKGSGGRSITPASASSFDGDVSWFFKK